MKEAYQVINPIQKETLLRKSKDIVAELRWNPVAISSFANWAEWRQVGLLTDWPEWRYTFLTAHSVLVLCWHTGRN